jgi:DNA replication protein DnaC
MTDQQDAAEFEPTFSHQSLPAGPDGQAAYGSLGEALEAATATMAPTFVDAAGDAAAERLRKLRGVRDQLPSNTRATRSELEARAPAKLVAIAQAWDWDSGNLLVLGPTRAGKTSGVALLVRLLMQRAIASRETFDAATRRFWGGCANHLQLAELIRWQSCRELTMATRESQLGHGAPDAIQRCQHARLLVLDDVGAGDDKGALERILNERYERRWPTITTAGLSSRELATTFGEALVRRMAERAGKAGQIVNLFPKEQP